MAGYYRFKKTTKALWRITQNSKIESITKTLRGYIATLTFYHAAASSTLQPMKGVHLDRAGASTPGHRRRQSISAIPNQREYILGLADPESQAASGSADSGNPKRVQKHPATFQRTLCPKRFTRAYNLRPISEHTLTSGRSSVPYAAKPSRGNTTVNATKAI